MNVVDGRDTYKRRSEQITCNIVEITYAEQLPYFSVIVSEYTDVAYLNAEKGQILLYIYGILCIKSHQNKAKYEIFYNLALCYLCKFVIFILFTH